jgi:3-isopropylmalate/(R)-2-methylmalate dehydratase large subunit
MGMTLTEKIIAAHCGAEHVAPGQFVTAKVDFALANDITAPLAIESFRKMGATTVFDPSRVALTPDHFTPNKDIKAATQAKIMREFAREQRVVHYFEVGRAGIEHVTLVEQGLTLPGEIVIGADSHTTTYGAVGAFAAGVGSADLAAVLAAGEIWLMVPATIRVEMTGKLRRWTSGKDVILTLIGRLGVDGATYKALEFCGPAIAALALDDRLTMANMAIEAGAKNGVFPADDVVLDYFRTRAARPFRPQYADPDAAYEATIPLDVSAIVPVVAMPHLPSNVKPAAEARDIRIDQVVIGSCTNGRFTDMETAAKILRGNKIAPDVRVIVIPGSMEIYRRCLDAGFIADFVDAGAFVSGPTCGPCLGGHMGVLAEGERALATTNRNFLGRMGHKTSEVYLCGPAVAAASALTGKITSPEEIGGAA